MTLDRVKVKWKYNQKVSKYIFRILSTKLRNALNNLTLFRWMEHQGLWWYQKYIWYEFIFAQGSFKLKIFQSTWSIITIIPSWFITWIYTLLLSISFCLLKRISKTKVKNYCKLNRNVPNMCKLNMSTYHHQF